MIGFDGEATRHSFTLRCTPRDTLRQRVLSQSMRVLPDTSVTLFRDAFGNSTVEGSIPRPHTQFSVYSEGTVEVPRDDPEEPIAEEPGSGDDAMLYRQHSGKTAPGPAIRSFLESAPVCDCTPLERAVGLMHRLHSRFTYEKGATDASTTAEEAMALGRGVCQDYAHMLISMLRSSGIPARYVVGYTAGEGESHAWVEVLHDGMWYGIDPTGDCLVGPRHIKVSHGRDYDDCRINRGVFIGARAVSQQVSATVNRVY